MFCTLDRPGTGPGRIVLALLLLALPSLALAQARVLTLESALQAARDNNPELAAARWGIDIAAGERRQAGVLPNPALSWEVEDTRKGSQTTTVGVSQLFELGGKRGARLDVADRDAQLAALELERQGNALRADVIGAFQAAAQAQEGLQLAEQSLRLSERALQVVQGRVKAGSASPVEATRAQVQLSEVRLEQGRAEQRLTIAYQQLAALTGAPMAPFSRVDGGLGADSSLPSRTLLLDRLEQTADLRLARLQIDQREAALGLARSQRIPDLTVSVGSQYSETDRERINVVGLSVPIPLFDRNQGNVLAAARRADQARDQRNGAELRLRSEVVQALTQWSTAAQEVQTFERSILPSAQQALDAATRGFERGKFAFLDVLDAQRTLVAARLQYLQAQAQSSEARVRLERIFGDLSLATR
ncbi:MULTISPECIES: TolC family protein [Pseudomonas]|uniref:TolC family protein n=1 Tax=Pseudomonas donghuensis TaxID=1163398 RepID=A0AAP0SFP0_9PSED|nr:MULTISPECIES: TolC family protein [Pseudomonas]MDF9895049.1 cobalt-zinc-cadmium efflux system outer membrane protein [Pseudomonas vranovensis]KDN97611.2 TolC family protein [Pseudomonas donghuensis]MBF4206714.1 TolC family protein [Pseudomonas donghuensis]MBS7597510.1 TolC family protein [Pseudomonas sp. RC2C2]MCP6690578.1 TolC family protein [Pseudomonas donghuensis]